MEERAFPRPQPKALPGQEPDQDLNGIEKRGGEDVPVEPAHLTSAREWVGRQVVTSRVSISRWPDEKDSSPGDGHGQRESTEQKKP